MLRAAPLIGLVGIIMDDLARFRLLEQSGTQMIALRQVPQALTRRVALKVVHLEIILRNGAECECLHLELMCSSG